jgi:hypothetical protein
VLGSFRAAPSGLRLRLNRRWTQADAGVPQDRNELATATPREVSVTGNTAELRIGGSDYWLTRAQTGWRISEVPLAVGG